MVPPPALMVMARPEVTALALGVVSSVPLSAASPSVTPPAAAPRSPSAPTWTVLASLTVVPPP
jgi:hypothetical protein